MLKPLYEKKYDSAEMQKGKQNVGMAHSQPNTNIHATKQIKYTSLKAANCGQLIHFKMQAKIQLT
jgi:hypothetical protein